MGLTPDPCGVKALRSGRKPSARDIVNGAFWELGGKARCEKRGEDA